MQFEAPLEQGRLLKRYKRFFADIESVDGSVVIAHCPNTGSMLNCLQEGAQAWFVRNDDPKRKLKATLEILTTPHGRLACVNTGRANGLVEEALKNGVITELAGFDRLRREVRYGEENSRADFCLEFAGQQVFVEVKSVTLGFADSDVAAFPDAVTERGTKHLRELTRLAQGGQRTVLLYCVNLTGISAVRAAAEIDPAYAAALAEAKAAGVEVLAYGVDIEPAANRIEVVRRLQVVA